MVWLIQAVKACLFQADKARAGAWCPVWALWPGQLWQGNSWGLRALSLSSQHILLLLGRGRALPLETFHHPCCSSKGQSQHRKQQEAANPPNPWLWEQCLGSKPKFHSCCLGNPWVDYDLLLENPCHGHV